MFNDKLKITCRLYDVFLDSVVLAHYGVLNRAKESQKQRKSAKAAELIKAAKSEEAEEIVVDTASFINHELCTILADQVDAAADMIDECVEPITLPVCKPITEVITMEMDSVEGEVVCDDYPVTYEQVTDEPIVDTQVSDNVPYFEEVQEYISVADACDSATFDVLCQQYDELVQQVELLLAQQPVTEVAQPEQNNGDD